MNLVHFLRQSRATGAFKDAVAAFLRDGAANDRVAFDGYAPPVKVERTLAKLLEAFPEMELERVVIQGASGCEYFRGKLSAFGPEGERRIRFHWDCKWRAEQEGWTDYFGLPDQARAAREFGYDCFRTWEVEEAGQPA